eukprot:scaffold322087_cov32-Tisochrysis_lutea.AAC.1
MCTCPACMRARCLRAKPTRMHCGTEATASRTPACASASIPRMKTYRMMPCALFYSPGCRLRWAPCVLVPLHHCNA